VVLLDCPYTVGQAITLFFVVFDYNRLYNFTTAIETITAYVMPAMHLTRGLIRRKCWPREFVVSAPHAAL